MDIERILDKVFTKYEDDRDFLENIFAKFYIYDDSENLVDLDIPSIRMLQDISGVHENVYDEVAVLDLYEKIQNFPKNKKSLLRQALIYLVKVYNGTKLGQSNKKDEVELPDGFVECHRTR